MRYPAIISGETGHYTVMFPDLDGCVALGIDLEDAIVRAEEAMQRWGGQADIRRWPRAANPCSQ